MQLSHTLPSENKKATPQIFFEMDQNAVNSFEELGFIILEDKKVANIVSNIQNHLLPIARLIAERDPHLKSRFSETKDLNFEALFNFCLANEKNQSASRAFYEIFPASSGLLSLMSDPHLNQWAKQLGVKFPFPSTLPLLRIDRPLDEIHATPPHQDYWFSLMSPNSITYWFPILPVTSEMGLLQVIPRSHRQGLIPFKESGAQNPFVAVESFKESDYQDVLVGPGQILIFSQMLVHRSGVNKSQKTRLTLQARYNDLRNMKSMTTTFTPIHSKFVKQQQADILSQTKDVT